MTKVLIGVILSLIAALGFVSFHVKQLRSKNLNLTTENRQLDSALAQSQKSFEQLQLAKEQEILILTESLSARESTIKSYDKYQKAATENQVECVNSVIDPSLVEWMLDQASYDRGEGAGENPSTGSTTQTMHRF